MLPRKAMTVMNSYAMRPATRDDLPVIVDIYNQSVVANTASADCEPATLEARETWFAELERRGLPILVIEREDLVVAWASINPYSPKSGYRFTGDVSVYVHLGWTGRGLGKALLPPLIAAAKAKGLHCLIASIAGDNAVSIRLHEAYGFVICGRYSELFQKFGEWQDVVHMQLMLDTP